MAAQFCPEPQGRRGPSTRMARGSSKGGSTHDPEGAADGHAGPGPGRPSSRSCIGGDADKCTPPLMQSVWSEVRTWGVELCGHSRPGDAATQDGVCRQRRQAGAGHDPQGEGGRERGPQAPRAGPASSLISRPCRVPWTPGDRASGTSDPGCPHVPAGIQCGVRLAQEGATLSAFPG